MISLRGSNAKTQFISQSHTEQYELSRTALQTSKRGYLISDSYNRNEKLECYIFLCISSNNTNVCTTECAIIGMDQKYRGGNKLSKLECQAKLRKKIKPFSYQSIWVFFFKV